MAKWPYNHPLWAKLRKRKLEASPFCQPCTMRGKQTLANTVDHIVAVAGGGQAFPPLSGLMAMCAACHNVKTAGVDRAGGDGIAFRGVGSDGLPVDPGHPFFTGNDANRKPSNGPRLSMAHPAWFRRCRVPLTIVCGPPGSGKTTYVNVHKRERSRVICLDNIAQSLGFGSRPVFAGSMLGDLLRRRNDALGELMRPNAAEMWSDAFLIVAEPKAERRQWWQDRVQPRSIVVMLTHADECKRRCRADADQGDRRTERALAFIDDWWRAYSPRPGDQCIFAGGNTP